MSVEPAKLDARPYSVQYELLRSQVIGAGKNAACGNTSCQPRGIGLALLLSEGMPGWLKAVEKVLRESAPPRAPELPDASPHVGSSHCSTAPVWLSSLRRHEITTLLASLVLSTRPVAH